VYDGIPELIASITERGDALAVVTTKPESQARLIVDHFPFGGAFARVYGPSDRHTHRSKAEMIADALADFGAAAEQATMIGDRHFDIEGARANGVRGLGVAWGFGSVDELRGAGAHAIADRPPDLDALLT
jgi:phosphoglycolate phosphatase